ncbi:MAG: hypothetical protein A3J83_02280 [Elusimicrobia bacterium RIFOXYA2_FULL_40_6]|nr:MAG: hypothetical protein A3J83_02280 [Elusimicrobia bacterium RIFOXYA2_FULL_40_6]
MKKSIFIVSILSLICVFFGCSRTTTDSATTATSQQEPAAGADKQTEGKKVVYTCPMHPEVKSDKPGKCPKCGMFLEKQVG